MSAVILPECRTKVATRGKFMHGTWCVPMYCGHCHVEGPMVPANATFTFWLCGPELNNCERHGEIYGLMAVPDEIFFGRVRDEMVASYGRVLTETEMLEELRNPNSKLSILAREAPKAR